MADEEILLSEAELRDLCTTTQEQRAKWLNALIVSERTEKPTNEDMITILIDLMAVLGEV